MVKSCQCCKGIAFHLIPFLRINYSKFIIPSACGSSDIFVAQHGQSVETTTSYNSSRSAGSEECMDEFQCHT